MSKGPSGAAELKTVMRPNLDDQNMSNETMETDHFTDLLESKASIPNDIVKYVSYCIEQGQTNQLLRELVRDAAKTAEGLDTFFYKASSITGHSTEGVLQATGFSWRDIDPSRIESAIAQLRAIFFLDTQQFINITLVHTEEGKSSDLIAIRNKEKFSIEVLNSIYDATERFSSQQLADWAFSRLISEGKKAQIASTSSKHSCTKGAFVAVVSTQATVALQTHDDFLEAASQTWDYIGSPQNINVCMVTGRVTPGYGPDDAIYPPWYS